MKQLFVIILVHSFIILKISAQENDSIKFSKCAELYNTGLLEEAYNCYLQYDASILAVYNTALIAKEIKDNFRFQQQSKKLLTDEFYSVQSIDWFIELHYPDTNNYLSILDSALQIFGKDTLLLTHKINYYILSEQYEKALVSLNNLSKSINNQNVDFLFSKGAVYDYLNKSDSALYFYQKALEIDSMHFSTNYNIGVNYYNKGIDVFGRTIYAPTKEEYQEKIERGNNYIIKSLPYFERIFRVNPTNESLNNMIKTIYERLGITNNLVYQYEIEIDKEYWKKDSIIPNDYFDDKYLNNGNLYLHFQESFNNDTAVIKTDDKIFGIYALNTDWSLSLAKVIEIPGIANFETVSVSLNGGKEAKLDIDKLNHITIIYTNDKLIFRYRKHMIYYD